MSSLFGTLAHSTLPRSLAIKTIVFPSRLTRPFSVRVLNPGPLVIKVSVLQSKHANRDACRTTLKTMISRFQCECNTYNAKRAAYNVLLKPEYLAIKVS